MDCMSGDGDLLGAVVVFVCILMCTWCVRAFAIWRMWSGSRSSVLNMMRRDVVLRISSLGNAASTRRICPVISAAMISIRPGVIGSVSSKSFWISMSTIAGAAVIFGIATCMMMHAVVCM